MNLRYLNTTFLGTFIPLPWQTMIPEWCVSNYRNAWTVKEYCSLFIGTGHSLWGITIMPLIKVYNINSDPYGLKGHSISKSVRSLIFGHVVIPKLFPFCRTFGDEAWSQQGEYLMEWSGSLCLRRRLQFPFNTPMTWFETYLKTH